MRRKTSKVVAFCFAVGLGALAYWLVVTSRAATRTPAYKVLLKHGGFEIREYSSLSLVNAPMGGVGMDTSFRKLFGFITGGNDRREKIKMTTPVLIGSSGSARTMGFIMPDDVVEQGLPKPADPSLSAGKVEPGTFAVLRFPGGRSDANEAQAVQSLNQWLAAHNLAGRDSPIFAYYDPPWTPIPLRRNEVLIRVQYRP